MTDLSSLISRVEKATEPSREIDEHIRRVLLVKNDAAYVAQSPFNGEWVIYAGEYNGRPRLYENRDRSISNDLWRGAYTASVDAAIALAERVLPGWDHGADSFGEDGAHARVWKHGWHDDTVIRADHVKPALALVLATLRAIQSQKGET